jgi:adenosine deaminase CECR1
MVLNVLDPDQVELGVDIFSESYQGDATNWKTEEWKWKVWMPWKKFQIDFEQRFPGEYVQPQQIANSTSANCCSEPFADTIALKPAEFWLKSKMVLSEKEAYDFGQTVNG